MTSEARNVIRPTITRSIVPNLPNPDGGPTECAASTLIRSSVGGVGGRCGVVEDRVACARLAVVVRAADDARLGVEVEAGWRRGDLPLERQRAPRVGRRGLTADPRDDRVVDEDERRGTEAER